MPYARSSRFTLFAMVAFLLQGCLGSETYYVDERFTGDEQQRIRDAARMWEEATGGSVHFDLVFGQRVDVADSDRRVIVKTSARAAFNRFPDMASDTRVALYHEGSTLQASQIVIIAERVELDMLRPTIAHEMGHAFGLRHVPEAGALMFENLNNDPTKCVTEDDLREARRFVQVAADQPCGKD
jgi:hypothetical protein